MRPPTSRAPRGRAALAAVVLIAAGCTTTRSTVPPPALPPSPTAVADDLTVESVTDGDTIVVTGGVRVRLIGIDTPETRHPDKAVECFAAEASVRTAELLGPGEPVHLVYDVGRTDRYGRTLAYVYRSSDALFVNAALVEEGYARAGSYPPNTAHDAELHRLQDQARAAGRGLWTACPVASYRRLLAVGGGRPRARSAARSTAAVGVAAAPRSGRHPQAPPPIPARPGAVVLASAASPGQSGPGTDAQE